MEAPIRVLLHPLPNEPGNLDNLVDYPPIEVAEINILRIEPELPGLPLEQLQDEGEGVVVSAEQENENIEAEVELDVNKNLEVEAELNANENIEAEINKDADANAMAGDGNPQEDMQHAIETLQQELERSTCKTETEIAKQGLIHLFFMAVPTKTSKHISSSSI